MTGLFDSAFFNLLYLSLISIKRSSRCLYIVLALLDKGIIPFGKCFIIPERFPVLAVQFLYLRLFLFLAAAKMAEQEGVDIRKYSVIYDAIEEVKSAMEGMLAPEVKEQVTATIEIREVFNITKVGLVAGAMVKTGKVKRSDKARLIRDGIVIFTGNINALKRFKDDVKEVGTNFECGISLVNCNDMKVGDMIEAFEEIEVKQTL